MQDNTTKLTRPISTTAHELASWQIQVMYVQASQKTGMSVRNKLLAN